MGGFSSALFEEGKRQALYLDLDFAGLDFSLTGSGTVGRDQLKGTYTLCLEDLPLLKFELKSFSLDSRKTGRQDIALEISLAVQEGQFDKVVKKALDMLSKLSYKAEIHTGEEGGSAKLVISTLLIPCATLGFNYDFTQDFSVAEISQESERYIDIFQDENASQELMDSLSLDALIENLSQIGLPPEYITTLCDFLFGKENPVSQFLKNRESASEGEGGTK